MKSHKNLASSYLEFSILTNDRYRTILEYELKPIKGKAMVAITIKPRAQAMFKSATKTQPKRLGTRCSSGGGETIRRPSNLDI